MLLALVARGPWVNPTWRHSIAGRATIEIAPSLFYERFLDKGYNQPGHCGACDFGWRSVGSAIVEITIR